MILGFPCGPCSSFGHPCYYHAKLAAGMFSTGRKYSRRRAARACRRRLEWERFKPLLQARLAELTRQGIPQAAHLYSGFVRDWSGAESLEAVQELGQMVRALMAELATEELVQAGRTRRKVA